MEVRMKAKVTLTLDRQIWEKFRVRAIRERTSGSAIIEHLMEEYLERGRQRTSHPAGDEGQGMGRGRNRGQRRGKQQDAEKDT
jgi:hypothetical protein